LIKMATGQLRRRLGVRPHPPLRWLSIASNRAETSPSLNGSATASTVVQPCVSADWKGICPAVGHLIRRPGQGLLESPGPSIYGAIWATACVTGHEHRRQVAVRAAVNAAPARLLPYQVDSFHTTCPIVGVRASAGVHHCGTGGERLLDWLPDEGRGRRVRSA
jgi:hypothetical protein